VLVFIDQVVEVFMDTGILLVVEIFIEYGPEAVDDIEGELDEMFFRQDSESDRILRAPIDD
jgi:hypothetical protein